MSSKLMTTALVIVVVFVGLTALDVLKKFGELANFEIRDKQERQADFKEFTVEFLCIDDQGNADTFDHSFNNGVHIADIVKTTKDVCEMYNKR